MAPEKEVEQTISAKTPELQSALEGGRSAISIAIADIYSSGKSDLITGYAVGSRGALLLQQNTAGTPAAGSTGSPFSTQAQAVDLPVRPDLLTVADFSGHGHNDVAVAAQGGTVAYLLAGSGSGSLAAAQPLVLAGTATASGSWTSANAVTYVVTGICSSGNCGLQLSPMKSTLVIPLPAAASSIQTVSVNNGATKDIVVLTSAGISIVDGDTILSGSPKVNQISISNGRAIASGIFAYDRRGFAQIAVLGSDAVLHVFARSGTDSSGATIKDVQAIRRKTVTRSVISPRGLAWSEVETVSSVGTVSDNLFMVSGRFTGSGYDDLLVTSAGQKVKVAHPIKLSGATFRTTPIVSVQSSSATAATAIAVGRVSPTSQLSVVAANGGPTPSYTVPATNNTWAVNTTVDSLDDMTVVGRCTDPTVPCTLRDAIALANNDYANGYSGIDTITIPAGTYALSATNGSTYDANGSVNYHFDVDAPASFVGAGSASTIIDVSNLDKAFTVNSGMVNFISPIDVFFSGMTLQNGLNSNNPASAICTFCDNFGGLLDFEADGPGTLNLSDVKLIRGTVLYGPGGGLYATNAGTSSPSGQIEFDNSFILNDATPEQGGGLWIGDFLPLTLKNDILSSNTASPAVNSGDTSSDGIGGGLYLQGGSNALIAISNSTFTSNNATDSGGGLYAINIGPAITSTSFNSNISGAFGGAIYLNNTGSPNSGGFPASITTSTFTGNKLTGSPGQQYSGPYSANGAGVCIETGPGSTTAPVTVQYSRFHGNTGGYSTGLGVGCTSSSTFATVVALDNWWGCNGGGAGAGCDTAASAFSSTATLTLKPYMILSLSLSTATPALGSTFSATGSLGQDSGGAVLSQGNDFALDGLPATVTVTQADASTMGSVSSVLGTTAPSISFAALAASTTARVLGAGTATVNVDNATVSRSFVVQATATTLVFSTAPPSSLSAGGNAGTVQVMLKDGSGNIATSNSSTVVSLAVTGPNGYAQTYTATASNGIASFSLGSAALTVAGTYTYTATAPNLTQATYSEAVAAGAFARLGVTGLGTFAAPGLSGTALISALDAYGNLIPSFTGTVSLTSTDPLAVSTPGTYTYTGSDQGTHSFSVAFGTAGMQALTATSGTGFGSETGILVEDAIWVLNQSNQVARLTDAGTPINSFGPSSGLSPYGSVAFDNVGNAWVTELDSNTVIKYSAVGISVVSATNTGGLYQPTVLAVDGLGQPWIANNGTQSLTVLNSAGAALSPINGLQHGNIVAPTGIAIDSSGSVWVTTSGANPVVKVVGVAAPVTTPTATATATNSLGARP